MVYDSWDLEPAESPPRSRLYHLRPIGIGTPEVESLTSYVMRLAEAHAVSTRTLIHKEVLPLLPSIPLHPTPLTLHSLNGLGNSFGQWIVVLEKLTARTDLRSLTLLPWSTVFCSYGAMRRHKAWCPQCLRDRRNLSQPCYELLLWALSLTKICRKHSVPLADHCPCCGKRMLLLLGRSRPGYCTFCGWWLGDCNAQPCKSDCDRDNEVQAWSAGVLGELLAIGSTLNRLPPLAHLQNNLKRAIENLAAGKQAAIYRATDMIQGSFFNLINSTSPRSLPLIMQLCQNLRLPPARLLLEEISIDDPVWTIAREIIRTKEAAFTARAPVVHQSTAVRLWPTSSTEEREAARQKVKAALEANLERQMPQSFRAAVRSSGYRCFSSARRWFPQLGAAIKAKHKRRHQRYAQRLRAALKKQPPPRVKEIALQLEIPTDSLRHLFPALCLALDAAESERRRFEKRQLEEQLKEALAEDPPPPLKILAPRLGHSDDFLKREFPELCCRICDHSLMYRRTAIQQKNSSYQCEVRQAMAEITGLGKRPSPRNILSVITRRNPTLTSTASVILAMKTLRDQVATSEGKCDAQFRKQPRIRQSGLELLQP